MAERQQRKAAANRRNAAELLADDIQDDFVEEKAPKSRKSSDKIERVRVWWPPTRNKARSGFSGAYWPAIVVKKGGNFLEVEYDNGEREKVDPDNIFPHEVPIDFGKEGQALEVGEFVEVSNNSKTDPCAWVGCVASIGKKYLIDYPFHDSPSEYIKVELLRRARVWDDLDWKYIEVGQQWKPGEVTSPIELNLLPEKDYFADLKQGAGSSKGKGKRVAAKAAAAEESEESEDDKEEEDQEEEEEEGSSEEEPQPRKQTSSRKRGRPRKPVHPTRASLDEGSNGSGDDNKNDRPKGAKKRKPAAVRQA